MVLCHGETVIIKLQATKSDLPIHYQIAKQTVENCERWGVSDDMFGIDVTAEGEGPAGVLVQERLLAGLEFCVSISTVERPMSPFPTRIRCRLIRNTTGE